MAADQGKKLLPYRVTATLQVSVLPPLQTDTSNDAGDPFAALNMTRPL
jgi:hypothetical protein